jgi:hypothetical protein
MVRVQRPFSAHPTLDEDLLSLPDRGYASRSNGPLVVAVIGTCSSSWQPAEFKQEADPIETPARPFIFQAA